MSTKSGSFTIKRSIDFYINNISLARSENTARTYRNALNLFQEVLEAYNLPIETSMIEELPEDAIAWFAKYLKIYSPATERLYLSAAKGYYEYLAGENIAELNLPRIRMLIRQRARRYGQRLPQFPRDEIDEMNIYAQSLVNLHPEDVSERLRNLRDRAFLLTLADTGLRVHEACALRRGDIDWNEAKALVIGKGDKQAVVRFSTRSINAIKDYVALRSSLDGASGRPLSSLPIFARHDRGAGKKILSITTTTGRNIVSQRVREALGENAVGRITPHSFRHYFVTTVLRGSGGNLKLAQELARHKNIAVTQRYAHLSDDELDLGYHDIFDEQIK